MSCLLEWVVGGGGGARVLSRAQETCFLDVIYPGSYGGKQFGVFKHLLTRCIKGAIIILLDNIREIIMIRRCTYFVTRVTCNLLSQSQCQKTRFSGVWGILGGTLSCSDYKRKRSGRLTDY